MVNLPVSRMPLPAAYLVVCFILVACAPKQLLVPTGEDTAYLKAYARYSLTPGKRQFVWKETGIEVLESDRILVLVSPESDDFKSHAQWQLAGITARVGEFFRESFTESQVYFTSTDPGILSFGSAINIRDKSTLIRPTLVIDVLVVNQNAESRLPAILRMLSKSNPEDRYIKPHLTDLQIFELSEMDSMDEQNLINIWKNSILFPVREEVVTMLEKRGASAAIAECYLLVLKDSEQYERRDWVAILQALRRMQEPETLNVLERTPYLRNPEEATLFLSALKEIGHRRGVDLAVKYVDHKDMDVSLYAMETLGGLAESDDADRIYPLLFHQKPDIRWMAIKIAGRIGGPEIVERLSVFLADEDATVRGVARATLQSLGVIEETIADWEKKASQLSLDDIYQSSVALKRAETEKEVLEKRLKNERDVKIRLQDSLKMKENALKNQERILEELYEKERQLKSMQFQLEQARNQASDYKNEMTQLEDREKELSDDLDRASSSAKRVDNKIALDKVQTEKARLERLAGELDSRETRLVEEFKMLNASTERMRQEADEAKELVENLRGREAQLTGQVEMLRARMDRGMSPVVVVSRPESGSVVTNDAVTLQFVAIDDRGIADIRVLVNGQQVGVDIGRGIQVALKKTGNASKMESYSELIGLRNGENTIQVTVVDTDGTEVSESVSVYREESSSRIWAAVVGINRYQDVRHLKYAVNDAQAFKKYLMEHLDVPEEQIFTLIDQEATKSRVQSLMGTQLKKKAGKEDTVYIYFAGHGAAETDPSNPDGDGFEKYLLPHDADLNDLYSSSISMKEVITIFQRIAADRLVFIADTCYSGASGGRTLLSTSTRATLSEQFFERLSEGKGRIILSASSANELSQELDIYGHGVFTYYLLKGLRGSADRDGDGLITVGEVFGYVSQKVPDATGQDQHPVKKGESQGEIVLGRVK